MRKQLSDRYSYFSAVNYSKRARKLENKILGLLNLVIQQSECIALSLAQAQFYVE